MGKQIDWLGALEARVHEAAEEIRRLRQENETLAARVGELEDQLEAAAATDAGETLAAWEGERQEIRDRVEHLAGTLAALLGE